MRRYSCGGRMSAAASATRAEICNVWHPASTDDALFLKEISLTNTAATVGRVGLSRTTAQGTAGATVTPDIDNDWDRKLAPTTGFTLGLGLYTAAATLAGPDMKHSNVPAAIGSGFIWVFDEPGIFIPAGTGLALHGQGAIFPIADVDVTVNEV